MLNSCQCKKGWLTDLPEDLDMFIAQRDFERAMELIDRSKYFALFFRVKIGYCQHAVSIVELKFL